jgi:DNA ligase 1
MLSEPIFQRDTKGKVRSWQFEVDGPRWRTISGLIDGEKVVSGWTDCVPKSQDTAEEQALFEAQAEEKKKLNRKYSRTVEELDVPKAAGVRPMLAHKYEGWSGECWAQGKLDGVRCIANAAGLWSRQGKPIVAVPHIIESLRPIFESHPNYIFDGELYRHDFSDDFNKIVSIVKKTKPTAADHEAAKVIQYHIYDMPSHPGTFADRTAFLVSRYIYDDVIVGVDTKHIKSEPELDAHYTELLEAGYEGQIVRLNGLYEQKRSKLLLKRKEFLDSEFEVVRIEEGNGNWSGYAKRAVLRLHDGREFGAGIKGNQDFCRRLLSMATPSSATVRYFTQTPGGIPRFPVVVSFFDGDRM